MERTPTDKLGGLVLRLKPGGRCVIVLPDGRQVRVENAGPRTTKTRIVAPPELPVLREELLDAPRRPAA